MTGDLVTGADVDAEDFSDKLRQLADALDGGGAFITHYSGGVDFEETETASICFELEFAVSEEYSDLMHMMEVEGSDSNDSR